MNTNTLDKLRRMRLFGMYATFKTSMETPRSEPLTADEMTARLVESEWDDRHNRNIERGLRNARFRYNATIEQIDYNADKPLTESPIKKSKSEFGKVVKALFS